MSDLSDGVIALPGGFGTMEELFEMLTWRQLSLHQKPMGLLNLDNFYSPLIQLLDRMVQQGFLTEENRTMLLVADGVEEILDLLELQSNLEQARWIKEEQL